MSSGTCGHCFAVLAANGPCPHCGYDAAADAGKFPLALPAGSILNGRYVLGHPLGQGGFGITYIAQDVQTGHKVAIKEFFPETMATRTDGPTVAAFTGQRQEDFQYGLQCFLAEAQTMAQFIGVENIVRVYSYFEENGTAYFAMDYVDGISLQAYLRRKGGRISWEEAASILLPVMDALSVVHSKGIIHRDISPDNIYITSDGKVKLLDFGAARYSLGDRSRSLDVVLKHGFAPKEQYTRRGRQGPYTDVYAMAATLYNAITGRILTESVDRMEEDDLVLPSSYGVAIPREAEDALEKGLAVLAADRYQTMAQFREALTAAAVPEELPQPAAVPKEPPKPAPVPQALPKPAPVPQAPPKPAPAPKAPPKPAAQPAAVPEKQAAMPEPVPVPVAAGKKKSGLWKGLAAGFAALAALLCCVLIFGGKKAESPPKKPAPTQAAVVNAPAPAPAPASPAAAEGEVYYLNFKPEADQVLQELAAAYNQETGISVKIVTAAAGTYAEILNAEMAKSNAPTIFNISNAASLKNWDDSVLDLRGTAIAAELTNNDFNLYNAGGELKAMGYCFESYGIIVNTALLEIAGISLDGITDFDSLKAAADHIHANADELGFDAFAAAGLDGSSSWRFSGHLANMPLFYEFRDDGVTEQPATVSGAYLDNYRKIWDLYITDSASDPRSLSTTGISEAQAQFMEGKAVFYQNGSWEYAALSEKMDSLAMIPIYCGVAGEENAGLCSGTENNWAINSNASPEDQQASLDFLHWLVTDAYASQRMVDIMGAMPFKAVPASANVFLANGADMLAEGRYAVTWAFNHTPNMDSWRRTLVTALAAYAAEPSDANWYKVEEAFVAGWAYEYSIANR